MAHTALTASPDATDGVSPVIPGMDPRHFVDLMRSEATLVFFLYFNHIMLIHSSLLSGDIHFKLRVTSNFAHRNDEVTSQV